MVKTVKGGKGGGGSDCNNICAEWHLSSSFLTFPHSFYSSAIHRLTAVDNCGTKREKHSNMQMHHRCHVQSRGACSRKLNKQVNYVQFITVSVNLYCDEPARGTAENIQTRGTS